MARTRRDETPQANSLVASAARIGKSGQKSYHRVAESIAWQSEAWRMYHIIGEFRYSCDFVGAMLSKAVLFASVKKAGKRKPVKTGPAVEIMESLFNDDDGRAEMLRQIGIHMTVAGELYVVSYPNTEEFGGDEDVWEIATPAQVKKTEGGKWRVNNKDLDVDPEDVLVIRVWRPDPEKPWLATSPAQAVLPILGEIYGLTQHVAAQIDSRLAGAGILLVPSEMTFPAPPPIEGAEQRVANDAEDLMRVLAEAMQTSIQNREDASALVPIVIKAPAEAIAAIKHLTFWTQLDEQAIALRNEAIRRLALGLDIPPEVLQGLSESNHWSAWAADESTIKAHAEPLLKLITTALAQGYLRPLLSDDVPSQTMRAFSIGADTSEMRLRPNRSKEALELYDRGELNGASLRRETGFDDEDAQKDEDRVLFYLRKVASGSTTPELVEAALKALGVKLEVPQQPVDQPTGTEGRPTPSLEDHPQTGIPDPEISNRRRDARDRGDVPSSLPENRAAALIAACEQVVMRALERAGNKLKNKMQVKPTCAAVDIYKFVRSEDTEFLLDDAWTHVAAIAERHRIPAKWLEGVLENYCTQLLKDQTPHTFNTFTLFMTSQMTVTGEKVPA
jgi:Phage portal protein